MKPNKRESTQNKKGDFKPKCELCGEEWYRNSNHAYNDDTTCIELNKRCVDCFQEWGDQWPDRV